MKLFKQCISSTGIRFKAELFDKCLLAKKKYIVNDIIPADSRELSKYIEPESVALTITSPPYRNAINYSQHVKNVKNNKRSQFRGDVGITTSDYLDEMVEIFFGGTQSNHSRRILLYSHWG